METWNSFVLRVSSTYILFVCVALMFIFQTTLLRYDWHQTLFWTAYIILSQATLPHSMVQSRKTKLLPPCPRCVARGPAHAVPVRIQCWLVQRRLPPKGRKCLGRPACHFHNFLVSQQRIMLHLQPVAVSQHIQRQSNQTIRSPLTCHLGMK